MIWNDWESKSTSRPNTTLRECYGQLKLHSQVVHGMEKATAPTHFSV